MDFSVIIPTIGRESLTRAVTSVLAQQTASAFQVIVVNDSGQPLPPAAWQTDTRVRVIATPRLERSRARNAGADTSVGAFLVFLDDDDWVLPDALESFRCATASEQLLVGNCRMVTPRGVPFATLQAEQEGNCAVQAIAGEWYPLPALAIARALFFSVGGFGPITLGEDREIVARLALSADLKRVRVPVACVGYDPKSSTSVYNAAQRERYQLARDELLNAPGSFARLRSSARDPYWRGRLARVYVNGTWLNLKSGQWLKAFARGKAAARTLLVYDALRHIPQFWRGVVRAHVSHSE